MCTKERYFTAVGLDDLVAPRDVDGRTMAITRPPATPVIVMVISASETTFMPKCYIAQNAREPAMAAPALSPYCVFDQVIDCAWIFCKVDKRSIFNLQLWRALDNVAGRFAKSIGKAVFYLTCLSSMLDRILATCVILARHSTMEPCRALWSGATTRSR